jgi:hypothetical protein
MRDAHIGVICRDERVFREIKTVLDNIVNIIIFHLIFYVNTN